ncbi:hypothetical protein EDD70_1070 [Hydrogenoanaerobacterium saccharovorans]|uniref:ATP-binding sugar transporter n=1 Tax=Hydrogenoanaerobacterium saccharovorans TaxID=474960 RepID=A0A1H8A057_9FIRM|nr:hypothetical protein [Hydrogenoanaerobacterium saccharovorans]RPF48255.1 hypothetical protein EDD70_1070 [Hydrogenoanaerobacterium saccharovorans]SEM63961.1 hypothetical protein SAMN05216180_1021 [Hydrogenoanaerobacterium saccharovorans]
MNFKAQIERDLNAIFHNSNEHACISEFWIGKNRYKGPVILDDGGAQDRKKPYADHVDGLTLVDLVMYAPLSLLKTTPKRGQTVEIGDDVYTVAKVHAEVGEVVLYLEMLAE